MRSCHFFRRLLPTALLMIAGSAGAQDVSRLQQLLQQTDLNSLKQHISNQDLATLRQRLDQSDLNTLKQHLSPQDLAQLQQQLGSTDLNRLKQHLDGQSLDSLKQQLDHTDLNSLKSHLQGTDLKDLAQQLGGSRLGSLQGLSGGSATALLGQLAPQASHSNVAGLLGYCLKNHYLGADSGAGSLQQKLLGTLAGRQDPGYQQGLRGILATGGGQQLDLGQQAGTLKQQLSDQMCRQVLKQGTALL